MRDKDIKIQDMIDFVTGSDSELSAMSEDEEEIEIDDVNTLVRPDDSETSDEEDNTPLINFLHNGAGGDAVSDAVDGPDNDNVPKQRVYRWRNQPSNHLLCSILKYFSRTMFLKESLK